MIYFYLAHSAKTLRQLKQCITTVLDINRQNFPNSFFAFRFAAIITLMLFSGHNNVHSFESLLSKNTDSSLHLYQEQMSNFVIENSGNSKVMSDGFASLPDGTVTAVASNDVNSKDALTVTFNEAWSGKIYLSHRSPLNLTKQIENATLEFDLNASNVDQAGIQVSMSCGANCTNLVDLWPFAIEHQGKGWQHLSIPLSCFASNDADFTQVTQPFSLSFDGSGEFSFANITLKPESKGNFNCPDQNLLSITPTPLRAFWADDWWTKRLHEKLHEKSQHHYQWIMIGDSITHNWEEIGKPVWQQYFSNIKTLNLGFGGNRTENVLWHIEQGLIENLNPKLVTMMIGTNNTGHRMDSPQSIRDGVAAILARLQSALPDSQIVLFAIFPRGLDAKDIERQNNEQTNALLSRLAQDLGINFANINKEFLNPDLTLSTDIMPDLLHPNEAGYEIWAKQLEPYVNKYILAQQK